MFERKNKIAVTEDEKNVIIRALVEFRNDLLKEGYYTDTVDDLLIRLCS